MGIDWGNLNEKLDQLKSGGTGYMLIADHNVVVEKAELQAK